MSIFGSSDEVEEMDMVGGRGFEGGFEIILFIGMIGWRAFEDGGKWLDTLPPDSMSTATFDGELPSARFAGSPYTWLEAFNIQRGGQRVVIVKGARTSLGAVIRVAMLSDDRCGLALLSLEPVRGFLGHECL